MKYQESETIELKASTAQLSTALEAICAFANTRLGTVYFGIENDGTVAGLGHASSSYLALIVFLISCT